MKILLYKVSVLAFLLLTIATGSFAAITYDWTGAHGNAWAQANNWSVGGATASKYPGQSATTDLAMIGVNVNYTTNQPIVTTTLPNNISSITFGSNNGAAITLTVTGVTLKVSNAVTQNHNSANGGLTSAITGTGTLTCGTLTVGDNTAPPPPSGSIFGGLVSPNENSTTVNLSIAALNVSTTVTLNSTSSALGTYDFFIQNYCVNNPVLDLISGTVTVNNIVTSNSNYVNYTDFIGTTISNSTAYQQTGSNTNTLNLLGNTPVTFATGAVIDFVSGTVGANSYVNYEAISGTQTVYTSADGINTTPDAYANLTLGAASAKKADGGTLTVGENLNTSGGAVNLNINNPVTTVSGSWANATTTTQGTGNITVIGSVTNNSGGTLKLATSNFYIGGNYTNNIGGIYTQSTGTTYFNGAGAQALVDNSTTATTFNNVTFNGSGTSTMSNGTNSVNFAVSSYGILTMTSPARLVAGSATAGYLTLNSDNTGSAAIAPITYAAPISGFVNVQRYLTGNRGYRLISSPVYAGNTGGNNICSLNYLYNCLYLTGTGGIAAGFTAGGNPTLYLYDEGFSPLYNTFLNSNFIGVSSISSGGGSTPAYSVNTNGGTLVGSYSLPVGTGFFCFFRGNLSEGAANLTNPSHTALTATATATGTLTQGQVTFKDWYTPALGTLGSSSQKFNLIGNPYAGAIDLGTIPTATTTTKIYATPYNSGTSKGITKFIYELNPVSHVFGVYTDDNSILPTNGASEYIASGQGFLVQAYGNACQFIFNETGKATTGSTATATNGLMVTKADLATISQVNTNPELRLKLALDSVNNEEIVLAFNPSAQTQYVVNEDAPNKPGQGQVGFSSNSSDNIQLAVNSMPLQKSQAINLNVYAQADGLFTLNMTQVRALPEIYDVWLMDAYKMDSLDIKHNPIYSFNIVSSDAASSGPNRFQVVIRQNPALAVHLLNFNATRATNGSAIVWKTENEENYTNFTVERSIDGGLTFNSLGALVSTGVSTYNFLDNSPSKIMDQYRLKLQDLNGDITYSNVVTLMYANTGPIAVNKISVYPNPAASTINLSVSQSTITDKVLVSKPSNPVYNITITNYMGAVIKTATSAQTSWQGDVSDLLPGAYLIQVVNANDKTVVGKTKFVKL